MHHFLTFLDLVMRLLSADNASEDNKPDVDSITKQLEALTPVVRDIAINFKKSGSSSVE